MQAELIDSRTHQEFSKIEESYRRQLAEFGSLLNDLSKTSNSAHLFHLTQRIQGCTEQERSEIY